MPASLSRTTTGSRWKIGRVLIFGLAAVLLATAGVGIWLSRNWPFTREAVTRTLEERFRRPVRIGRFRETWFPPGCVAGDISVPPLVTAQDLVIQASWAGLLGHHISRVKIVGLHVTLSPSEPILNSSAKSEVASIGEVEANDAVLEFPARTGDGTSSTIHIHQLVLDHLAKGSTVSFRASLKTDRPAGEVNARGQSGPWNASDPGATALSGVYQYANADLKTFNGLRGILSSQGKFDGTLSKIATEGTVDVPNFLVDGSAHSAHMTAQFSATVDARSADTVLKNVEAHVGRTIILGTGNVSGGRGTDGKTARLEMSVNTGRVEDLLNYFSDEKHATMTGNIQLRAYVELPPGPGFLRKVRLTGDFGIAGAKFTNPVRQTPVNRLSESASGEKKEQQEEDPRTVTSHLKGHVVVRDGVASLHNVSFEFPGAVAAMSGIYNLIPKTVDIHGTLRTDGTLSDASSGVKALMLKVATPFLKKHHTTIVPFTMTGPASHPAMGLDLRNKIKL